MIYIGLIGCGYISHKHLNALAEFSDMPLIAVSDIQKKQMEKAINFYQDKKGNCGPITLYENYYDMLTNPKIDAVIISVNSSLHAEIAKQALKYNKHIIIEKPLALSLKDANEIIDLSKKYNKVVLVCHQLRYRPLIQRVKELLEEGSFGKPYLGIVSIRLHRSADYYTSANWRGTWTYDGGMLLNQGIHLVDLLVWFMGDIESVYGEIATNVKNKEIEDIATGIISFKNNAKGVIEANTIMKPKNLGYYLSVFGEKGSICIGGQQFNEVEHCYLEDHPHIEDELRKLCNELNEHNLMYENFLEAVKKDQPILMDAQEGRKALETIFAVYQSDKKYKPVHFPMQDFSTSNMLEN